MVYPIKICNTLNKWWTIGFNKGWYRNEYKNDRFESCGFITIYAFKKAAHVLWSYEWYKWWLSTRDKEFEGLDNFILFPFGPGYPRKQCWIGRSFKA